MSYYQHCILHGLSWLLFLSTLCLLYAGALVTSTGSSLAVPDWPLAYGEWFPPMVGGILYEHGHRLVAMWVGFLTAAIAGVCWLGRFKHSLRRLSLGMLVLVVFQGLLGGITVLFLLPKVVSIAHAVTAQVYFLCTVALVQQTAPKGFFTQPLDPTAVSSAQTIGVWAQWLCVALIVQLIFGAAVRHFGAGLVIPDFPLSYGKLFPAEVFSAFPVFVHFLHRSFAYVVVVLAVSVSIFGLTRRSLHTVLGFWFAAIIVLVIIQFSLGASIIWLQRPLHVTSFHVLNGALLLACVWVVWLRCRYLRKNHAC